MGYRQDIAVRVAAAGLAGLSAGFPLALFMFIGWENGPALAEEWRSRPPCSSSSPT
jgi:hypothetical protein